MKDVVGTVRVPQLDRGNRLANGNLKRNPMSPMLQQAFDEISQLSPSEQNYYAARMLAVLRSGQRWQDLFNRSPELLTKMADEVLAEDNEGG